MKTTRLINSANKANINDVYNNNVISEYVKVLLTVPITIFTKNQNTVNINIAVTITGE